MALNGKLYRTTPPEQRALTRGRSAAFRPALAHARSGGRVRRVSAGLRAALNHHAAKSLRAARGSGVRARGHFPRILRLPRLRNVGAASWPCSKAQHLVPVTWFTNQWTPRVRVHRLRPQVTAKSSES